MTRVFVAWCVGVSLLSAVVSWRGYDPFAARKGFIPAGARQAPGGYRSFTYWRGGK